MRYAAKSGAKGALKQERSQWFLMLSTERAVEDN
jgi:hypothetical protein